MSVIEVSIVNSNSDDDFHSNVMTSTSTTPTDCSVCGFSAPDLRKLKSHLLLKHPKLNLCLFCVEKKGWSDTFASQASYKSHYESAHSGATAKRDEMRREELRRKRKWRQKRAEARKRGDAKLPKRPRPINVCFLCPDKAKPEFEDPAEFDRHQISVHNFDYCKLCRLIGPAPTVRYHIVDEEVDLLCPICAGCSPVFKASGALRAHLKRNHNLAGGRMICHDCPSGKRVIYGDLNEYKQHLLADHLTKGDKLRSMKRRTLTEDEKREMRGEEIDESRLCDNDDEENPTEEISALAPVKGIENETGQDCFSISIIHLLAQTELFHGSPCERENCAGAGCILTEFMKKYKNRSRSHLNIDDIAKHYSRAFGLNRVPVDCGDFLRSSLKNAAYSNCDASSARIEELCQISLQWKLECSGCSRFVVSSIKDFVLTLDGGAESGSLEELLRRFLHEKRCVSCGNRAEDIEPEVRHLGRYIFVEIDRTTVSSTDEESKELSLYSLQLKSEYEVLGVKYSLLGCVNYDLEHESGGGHFITYLFNNGGLLTRVHETESKQSQDRKPDFDSDVVIVALAKKDRGDNVVVDINDDEVTIGDREEIEIEIQI